MTFLEQEVLQKAVNIWGVTAQLMMLGEECCECGQAVFKFVAGRETSTAHLAEEIADVSIMVDQMHLKWGKEIDAARAAKIARLEQRLEKAAKKEPPIISEIPLLPADSFTFDRYYSDTWMLIKEFADAEGKSLLETFQKYCIGYCPGNKLLVRPCPGDLVAMIQIGDDKYWVHLPARAYIGQEWWPVYDLFAKATV